jgi:AraC-like DNA-binding protein
MSRTAADPPGGAAPGRRPRPAAARDWAAEQRRFLAAIAPESHFHRAFDGLGDTFFFAKNLAGETLFFSRGILPHIGLDRDEQMLGATDEELTPGPFAAHYRADDRTVIETRQPLIAHVDVWFDEVGLPDWYETNKYPIFDRAGRVIGVMGTLRRCHAGTAPGVTGRRLDPALSILWQEPQRFPPLSRLAKACGMSPRHLQRSFHELFGCGPRTYWIKCRIRAACQALREGKRSIAEVSADLGFCDQSNFTLHFRRHTGVTPSVYVRQRGCPLARNLAALGPLPTGRGRGSKPALNDRRPRLDGHPRRGSRLSARTVVVAAVAPARKGGQR